MFGRWPRTPPSPTAPTSRPRTPRRAPRRRDRERERDRGLSDFVRRAVAAGFEAAGRSKEDFVRIATGEIRDWLDRLELDTELRKALSRMVLEVKAEIRFRPPRARRWPPRPRATCTSASASPRRELSRARRAAVARVFSPRAGGAFSVLSTRMSTGTFAIKTEGTLPLGSGFAGRGHVAPGSRRRPGGHHPHLPGLGGRRRIQRRPRAQALLRPATPPWSPPSPTTRWAGWCRTSSTRAASTRATSSG